MGILTNSDHTDIYRFFTQTPCQHTNIVIHVSFCFHEYKFF